VRQTRDHSALVSRRVRLSDTGLGGRFGSIGYTPRPRFPAPDFLSDPQALHADSSVAPARVLRLKRGEDRRLAAGRLRVFSNEIDTASTPLTAFDVDAAAQLRTSRDALLGSVCVIAHALICARILSRDAAQPVDRALI